MINTKKINLGYVGEVKGYKGDIKALIQCMDTDNATPIDDINLMETHITEKIGDETFLVFTTNGTSRIYKQLPLVDNDDTFRWEKRTWANGRQEMFAKVDMGMFRFCCTANTEFGDGRVNVYLLTNPKYNGKIDTIFIEDFAADNDAFLEAINEYINNFVNKVMYQFDIPKGSNYPKEN